MLKIFIAFVRKEIAHILRDTRTLVILLGMPIALVFIFGYTVSNEFKDASIGVLDQSKDEASRELISHLTSSGHFRLVTLADDIEEIEGAFRANEIKLGIIIPPEFEAGIYRFKQTSIQLIADATEPNYATTLSAYASQMIRDFQMEKAPGFAPPMQIGVESRMFYNPQLIGAYNFIPGVVALILMLICAMMTSLTIAKEKETGTMDLLLVSPLPPMLIILGKVTPYVILSFINALVVFALGYFLFDVPIYGNLFLLLGLTLLYLLVALGLGVLISTRSNSQQMAMMASLFTLMMPTMLLSGFLFPVASMPALLQYLSRIIPARYFIQIEQAIMLKRASWEAVAFPSMILTLMALVLFLASFRSFKVVYR